MMAGTAVYLIANLFIADSMDWDNFLSKVLIISILANLFVLLIELTITHPTEDAKMTVKMILQGRYKRQFSMGSILVGNILPFALIMSANPILVALAGVMVLVGIYYTDKIWIEAPQRISLT